MSSIFEFVKNQRDRHRTDTVEITDGYEFSQYETLRTIELHYNSRCLPGNPRHVNAMTDVVRDGCKRGRG